MRKKYLLLFLLCITACTVEVFHIEELSPKNKTENNWTHLIYMAADNSLDSQSLNDLSEMEAAMDLSTVGMKVIILIDRKQNNGDWSDTRLYELVNSPGINSAQIVSKRIACPELHISETSNTELNMADPINLERFIRFGITQYPAKHYSLTIWGHGTGWRNSNNGYGSNILPARAIAIDDTSDSYMRIADAANAIKTALDICVKNKKLDVIGFDTCFAGLIEVAYPLADCAHYLVGSIGPVRESGWNYTNLFNLMALSDMQPLNWCNAILEQFAQSYTNYEQASISIIYLEQINKLQKEFNDWAQQIAAYIASIENELERIELQKSIRQMLLQASDAFYFPASQSDYYIDIQNLVDIICSLSEQEIPQNLIHSLSQTVYKTWSFKHGQNKNHIGIYIAGINSNKMFDTTHSCEYTIGSGAASNPFVIDTEAWSVHQDKTKMSVLNQIFY